MIKIARAKGADLASHGEEAASRTMLSWVETPHLETTSTLPS